MKENFITCKTGVRMCIRCKERRNHGYQNTQHTHTMQTTKNAIKQWYQESSQNT